jgi:hypothetical protein
VIGVFAPPLRVVLDGLVVDGLRFKKWSRTYTPAPPTTSHCAASNAQPPAVRVLIREMGSEARASLSGPRSLASAHRFGRAPAHVPMRLHGAWGRKGGKADARAE